MDLVLIDPPYNINKDKTWDNRKKDEYIEFMGEVYTKANTILNDNGTLIFFHNEMPLIAELMMWIWNNLPTFCYNSFIVCDKGDFRALSWKNPTDDNNFAVGLTLASISLFIPKAMNYIALLIRLGGIEYD